MHERFLIFLRFRNGRIFRGVRTIDKLKSYNSLTGYLQMSVLLTGTIHIPLQNGNLKMFFSENDIFFDK